MRMVHCSFWVIAWSEVVGSSALTWLRADFSRKDYNGPAITDLTEIIKLVKPTALLGLSTTKVRPRPPSSYPLPPFFLRFSFMTMLAHAHTTAPHRARSTSP